MIWRCKDNIQHRLHLRQVFLCLRQHGLVINAENCVFGALYIDFFGHRVNGGGVTPLPTYVSAVLDFPHPNMSRSCKGSWASSTFTPAIFRQWPAPSSPSQTP
jgi:hypothetical protein